MAFWFAKIINTNTEICHCFGPFESLEMAKNEQDNQMKCKEWSLTEIYKAYDREWAMTMAIRFANELEVKLSGREIPQTKRLAYQRGYSSANQFYKNPYREGTVRYNDFLLGWQRGGN
ncbi:hypothetical protein ABT56_12870 [Photobacterium aquae]|uniref:Uncharacterized protein n=1 Tax=Photobacterium aquae TaxID=1195763 RepID=A0A0J1JS46_9GAMM|nr:hypothetical protein [Photobacterium aquae]KLV05087.1 hypothetical protein ABT56_12870 [Photobacterium aquae]